LTEKKLIKACLKNDMKAKCILYKEHEQMMFAVCMRYASSKPEAEDMLHDGFIRVLDKLDKYRFEGPLGAWIRRVLVNNCLNYLRSKKTFEEDIEEVNESKLDYSYDDLDGMLSAKELLAFIQELPDGYRTVFNMYAIEGYKHKEIAEHLGITENTSKSQLAKARKALQEKIKTANLEIS